MTRLTIHIHNRNQLDDFLKLVSKHGVCYSIEGPDLHYEEGLLRKAGNPKPKHEKEMKKRDNTCVWRS